MRNYLFERERAAALSAPVDAAGGRRRQKRRTVLSAMVFLLLICGLTVALVWFRQAEGSVLDHLEDAAGRYDDTDRYFGIYPGLPSGDGQTGTSIPRARAGIDPLLTLTERDGDPLTAEEIYQKVLPSVVSISAYSLEMGSSGSGVVLSEDGYIITNFHVIEGMSHANVTLLSTGETASARLVGYDEEMDIAVLKVNLEGLVPAQFASSRELAIGEKVYAIGNPMGYLYGTITDGIVSYMDRAVSVSGHAMTLIQTNAALNSGNSGGALVNQWGQVVGITVAKIDPPSEVTTEGLGLAIPISEARRCVNMLLRLGKMESPAIGILGRSWLRGDGVLIEQVNPDSPAEAAGLRARDVILSAGGQPVDSVAALKDVIFELGVGAEMDCTVLRDGKELEFTLLLGEG